MAQPQPQPQVPQRTFSPTTSQLSPSPGPHATSFAGQPPPSKKPRLSPAPSPQGLAPSPGAIFSPLAQNSGLTSASSPGTPSTPNSLASPLATPSNALPVTSAPGPSPLPSALPLPSAGLPSAGTSPVPSSTPLPAGVGGPGTAYQFQRTASNGSATPKLQLPVSSPAPQQMFSPRTAHTPTPPTPSGPLTPSGPPLPQLAPAPTAGAPQQPYQQQMYQQQHHQQMASSGGMFAPVVMSPAGQTPTSATPTGVMGPPQKPADRPTKEYQYDVDDSLAGTGIDLRQEEQFQAEYFAGTYRPEARTGFPANTPGGRGSFYGSLVANQPAETIDEANQRKVELEMAKQKWTDAARDMAAARSSALHNRFLEFGAVHLRLEKIAEEYGVGVLLEPKTAPAASGRLRPDAEVPKPSVTVTTKVGPDGVAFVSTTSACLPEDTYLADQLALLSLATKHRLRTLLEDANKVAITRQRTSHGVVPDDWLDAAAPLSTTGASAEGDKEAGDAAGGAGGSNPLKRPLDTEEDAAKMAKKIAGANMLIQSLRVVSKGERSIEEQRLIKRQKREGKKMDGGGGGGAASSPATPGAAGAGGSGGLGSGSGATPDAGAAAGGGGDSKAPTKKELKKNAAAKMSEQNDTMSANRTSMAFLGGRKKQYSWLSGGSGASTPRRGLPGSGGGGGGGDGGGGGAGGAGGGGAGGAGAAGGGGGGTPGRAGSGSGMLAPEGRTKWGSWREDGIKGKDIQLRDLVVVLEADGRETVALQTAYDKLDGMPAAAARPGV